MKYILTNSIACTYEDYLYLLVAGEIVEWLRGVNNHTFVKHNGRVYKIRDADWENNHKVWKGE